MRVSPIGNSKNHTSFGAIRAFKVNDKNLQIIKDNFLDSSDLGRFTRGVYSYTPKYVDKAHKNIFDKNKNLCFVISGIVDNFRFNILNNILTIMKSRDEILKIVRSQIGSFRYSSADDATKFIKDLKSNRLDFETLK